MKDILSNNGLPRLKKAELNFGDCNSATMNIGYLKDPKESNYRL